MDTNDAGNDPMNFMRNLWGNMGFNLPGMVTPTFDVNELEKRISDLKAVEGWLRMNLSMLQMTIQGLEMQRATLSVVQAMGDAASKASEVAQGKSEVRPPQPPPPPPQPAEPVADAPTEDGGNSEAISQAALWPWTLMQQMQEAIQQAQPPADTTKPATKARARRPAAKGKAKTK